MSDLQKAAEDIQSLASKFAGITALGEVLAKAGSVDQIVKESGARAEAAKLAEQVAKDAHGEALTLLTAAKVELAKTQIDVAAHIESAHAEADKIIGEAHVEHSRIVDEAKKLGAEIEQHFVKVKAEAVELEQKVIAKITEHDALSEAIDGWKAKLKAFAS